jgi:hypothetical protein
LICRERWIILNLYLPFSFLYKNKLMIPFLFQAKESEVLCSLFRSVSTTKDLSFRYGIIQDSVWTLYPISSLCFHISTLTNMCNLNAEDL